MGENKNPKIYSAIAGVINDVNPVGKDGYNQMQKFKFRSIDDVYNAIHPALAKNKVVIVPNILDQTREAVGKTRNGATQTHVTTTIDYILYAEDGSSITSRIIGEAIDTGDKATNKCMSIAYKYLCFQMFCIPTEDIQEDMKETVKDKDPDSRSPEVKKTVSSKSKASTVKKKPEAVTAGTDPKITTDMVNTINHEFERTGIEKEKILKLFNVEHIVDMTVTDFKKAMKRFEITPDRKDKK